MNTSKYMSQEKRPQPLGSVQTTIHRQEHVRININGCRNICGLYMQDSQGCRSFGNIFDRCRDSINRHTIQTVPIGAHFINAFLPGGNIWSEQQPRPNGRHLVDKLFLRWSNGRRPRSLERLRDELVRLLCEAYSHDTASISSPMSISFRL